MRVMQWTLAMMTTCVVVLSACGSVSNPSRLDASIDAQDLDAQRIDSATIDSPTIDAMSCVSNPLGLAGRWRGDMTASDEVPGGHSGVTAGNLSYVPGKHGFAFQLDGSTNVITIDDAETLWPAASFSLEAWVKTTGSGNIFTKYQCGSLCPLNRSNALWQLQIDGTGHPLFAFRSDATATEAILTDGQTAINDGQWHHLVGVRDTASGNAFLYVDGALRATLTPSVDHMGPMTNTDDSGDLVVIGGQFLGGTSSLIGLLGGTIDEVSYYASALSASQVAAIYAAPDGECH
jgi:hypothetical protein